MRPKAWVYHTLLESRTPDEKRHSVLLFYELSVMVTGEAGRLLVRYLLESCQWFNT